VAGSTTEKNTNAKTENNVVRFVSRAVKALSIQQLEALPVAA
jgi:hypothetical protein